MNDNEQHRRRLALEDLTKEQRQRLRAATRLLIAYLAAQIQRPDEPDGERSED